jgi:hypothetical protein
VHDAQPLASGDGVLPALHGLHAAAPAAAKDPGAQLSQLVGLSEDEYHPGAQSTQLVAPVLSWYVPAGQLRQSDVAPAVVE